MRFHSYVTLAFAFLGHAIRCEAIARTAEQMQRDAEEKRAAADYDRCAEAMRAHWWQDCTCGGHSDSDIWWDEEGDRHVRS